MTDQTADELARLKAEAEQFSNDLDAQVAAAEEAVRSHLPNGDDDLLREILAAQKDPVRYNQTDFGNGELIAALYGDRLRFDHRKGRWLIWGKHTWNEDHDGEVRRFALEAARKRFEATPTLSSVEERRRYSAWALTSESRMRIDAALSLASCLKPIADKGDEWDADPMLLGAPNGVIDLRTGILRDGRPEDRITKRVAVRYDPRADCPRWKQFLSEIYSGDAELIHFDQLLSGYSTTGLTQEQLLVICYGVGGNGKSKRLNVQRRVMGDYGINVPFQTFEHQHRLGPSNDVADLEGRRFVTASETSEMARLNEARIKALTGGDPVTARHLYKEYATFQPSAKIWLGVNHRPPVQDDSYGFWRRVRLIPFLRQFKGEADDQKLEGKLMSEAPGVLRWLVEGAVLWNREGLGDIPKCVKESTESYRQESDPLRPFLITACLTGSHYQTSASDLFQAYRIWAATEGILKADRMTQTAFGRRMADKFQKQRTNRGLVYVGIGLRAKP